eukprot:TRINITY_DN936_c0_g1_i1.p2 TRINITY_DN936_c0_g1~~TRINITY_DN936_c0_g1_i1.p2  ORF type:complete len:283 (+),score=38.93 TRINITY_DN936_c0_g1_i1:44-892(+)
MQRNDHLHLQLNYIHQSGAGAILNILHILKKQVTMLYVAFIFLSYLVLEGVSEAVTTEQDEIVCPPPGFDAVKPFGLDDLEEYISAPWYVQLQMPLSYQPTEDLYCVKAWYVPIDENDVAKGVNVLNYANKGQVNGPVTGTAGVIGGGLPLIAIVPDVDQASKLRVGLSFLRIISAIAYGDYWIIATGSSTNDTDYSFDWAIISGGAPTRKTEYGCATGVEWDFFRRYQTNGVGLWLFTRAKVASEDTIDTMVAKAEELGFDTSVLVQVEQEGCLYEDDIVE